MSENASAGPSTFQVSSAPPSASLAPLKPVVGGSSTSIPDNGLVVAPSGPNVFTEAQIEEWKEQDRYLPIANVGRIMKNILPDNAKIAKEAKECVQECVSEFISFLSSEAADKVLTDKRKTINGEDIIWSMVGLGFDNYAEACKVYLAKYRHWLNEQSNSRLSSRLPSPSLENPPSHLQTFLTSSPSAESDETGPIPRQFTTFKNGQNSVRGKKRKAGGGGEEKGGEGVKKRKGKGGA